MRHPVLDSTRVYWTSNFMRDAARAFTIFKASFDPHSSPLALPCYLRFLESTRLIKLIFWQITQKCDSALTIFSLFFNACFAVIRGVHEQRWLNFRKFFPLAQISKRKGAKLRLWALSGHLNRRCSGLWFGTFFWDLSQSEKISKIKLPLSKYFFL